MAFATGNTVMGTVEDLVKNLLSWLRENWTLEPRDGELVPLLQTNVCDPHIIHTQLISQGLEFPDLSGEPFPRMSYNDVMTKYGSDKPDLRIPGEVGSCYLSAERR